MFEDSMVESSGKLKSKLGRWMFVTAACNLVIVAAMMLLPLLYPDALPHTVLTAILPVPPLAASRPQPKPLPQAVKATAPLDPFTAPASVPHTIPKVQDEPAPIAIVGLAANNMADSLGIGLGSANSLGLGETPVVATKTEMPKAPKPQGPSRVSSGVMAGQLQVKTQPLYPSIARAAHVSGTVVLRAIISKDGGVEQLTVISGPEMLRSSAVAAVQQWRYKPYLLNGEPTEVDTNITVNFSFGS